MLVVEFDDGTSFELPCEYLRTHSPSAEVRGHGLSEPKLLTRQGVSQHSPASSRSGSYAVVLHFDDGHNTGIYVLVIPFTSLELNMEANQVRYDRAPAASAKSAVTKKPINAKTQSRY